MTERPFVGGVDTAVGPTPGYYPDPSVPGFVRYWGGTAWVPGTSRPAPSAGEVLEPPRFVARQSAPAPARYVPPPVAAPLPAVVVETGPVYLDQTSAGASFTFAPYPEPELRLGPAPAADQVPRAAPAPAVERAVETVRISRSEVAQPEAGPAWHADPGAQRGLLEPPDAPRWVSWGALPTDRAGGAVADPGGAAAVPVPASTPAPTPVPPPVAAAAALPVVRPAVVGPAVVRPAVVRPAAVRPAAVRPAAVRPAKAGEPAGTRKAEVRPAAGLGRRLVARLLDSVVGAVVAVGVGLPLLSSTVEHVQQKLERARAASELTGRDVQVWLVDPVVVGKVAVLLGVLVLLGVVYEVIPTSRTGQTFGKRLVGVRVVDCGASGRGAGPLTLGRSVARWLVGQLGLLLVVGLFLPLFDRGARRGWQDRVARSRVVRT
ncbi:RDD family protein [Kitasatospora sp. MAP5-34]|uniref:RDD family protein n=1 Tax=Kitasatospora sp. MAP5-34 TaxID=3035102 RepID=UPI00247715AF|nr:RDD family protein [Kitasatospora sp. MAP5-34]MDH6577147.1 putative RDD family membrane protein YckC [Kitasatospora sp. MAP5-34]